MEERKEDLYKVFIDRWKEHIKAVIKFHEKLLQNIVIGCHIMPYYWLI